MLTGRDRSDQALGRNQLPSEGGVTKVGQFKVTRPRNPLRCFHCGALVNDKKWLTAYLVRGHIQKLCSVCLRYWESQR